MAQTVSLFIANLTIGGAERVVVNLSKGLSEAGYDVDIVLVERRGELLSQVPESVSIVELGVDRVRWSAVPLARYMRSKRPESFISFLTGTNVMAIVAHLLTGRSSNMIVTEHNTQTMKSNASSKRDQMLAKYLYRFADYIVGVSKGVSKDVSQWAKVDQDRVSTIYNPVLDDDLVNRDFAQPDCEWIDTNIPVVISAGRHVEQKDYPTLIRAFNELLSQRDARLIILGEGDLTDEYKTITDELGILDKVCFPGFVEDPYQYMSHADVFVLSSKWEGLSLVLIEAMGCGTPVVSTDCPHGPAEVLENGSYGPLVPVGDKSALADAMAMVLDSPEDKEVFLERASSFTVKNSVEEYMRIL